LRILVAEDNSLNQKLVSGLLRSLNHSVVLASSGEQACQAVREAKFDLVLMDVQMPGMNGLEATMEIRRNEVLAGPRLPIIAMTACAMPEDHDQCLRAGMDGYLTKPLNSAALASAINHHAHPEPR
jgi:CheY-like chemotaxis protein